MVAVFECKVRLSEAFLYYSDWLLHLINRDGFYILKLNVMRKLVEVVGVAYYTVADGASVYITVKRDSHSLDFRKIRRMCGLVVLFVTTNCSFGATKGLSLVGVGYKFVVRLGFLFVKLGYSHVSILRQRQGFLLDRISRGSLWVIGKKSHIVYGLCYLIRKLRRPDCYKGKGVRFSNEIVWLKPGKLT